MAQLIKLQDYISRYERDIFHYPGQFMRLKKENWKKVEEEWAIQKKNQSEDGWVENDNRVATSRWKSLFHRNGSDFSENQVEQSEDRLIPSDINDLKQHFLDNLLPFQLKWASTTVNEMSFLDQSYLDDLKLKYFLQRFPDIYLVLYYPTFDLKNNLVDGDIILVSPLEIEIIRFVEVESTASIVVGDDRTWYIETNQVQKSMLSPMISVNRTDQIVKSILKKYQFEFPVSKVILSRTNKIIYQQEPYNTKIIGSDSHEKWLNEKRKLISPIKHQQLKVCDYLLKHCYTHAVKRPEWDEER